jgi:hypothetical protein
MVAGDQIAVRDDGPVLSNLKTLAAIQEERL